MKKLLCLILALLLCPAAFADEDNWVEASPVLYVGAIEDVLFNTHNVTLTGEASFSVDGNCAVLVDLHGISGKGDHAL